MAIVSRPVRELDHPSPFAPSVRLLEFINALAVVQPTWKTYAISGQSAWVYREGDEMTMGTISHGDHSVNGKGSATFSVRSRLIVNSHRRDYTVQYNMKTIKKLADAVKFATKYLEPFTLHEIAHYYADPFNEALGDADGRRRKEAQKADVDLFMGPYTRSNSPLMEELKHMLSTGYEFHRPDLKEQVVAYITAIEERDKKRVSDGATFMHVTQSEAEPVVSVAQYAQVSRFNKMLPLATGDYPISALPEGLADKLAVLNLLSVGQYVEGVGQRVSDRSFYTINEYPSV